MSEVGTSPDVGTPSVAGTPDGSRGTMSDLTRPYRIDERTAPKYYRSTEFTNHSGLEFPQSDRFGYRNFGIISHQGPGLRTHGLDSSRIGYRREIRSFEGEIT